MLHEKGVISLSARHVHMAARTGPPIWHLSDPAFADLYCMSYTSKGMHEIIVAGAQDSMFKIDVEKGQITEMACLHLQRALLQLR
jgi:PAB-dependent poly(A)-specific ribonuclease subunit 2